MAEPSISSQRHVGPEPRRPSSKVELVRAAARHLPLLEAMFQLYVHDFSELVPARLTDAGRFDLERPLNVYFEDDWRHPFLIRVAGAWAGFAFAHQRSQLDDDPSTWDVSEFFVLRGFRRAGVGAAAAKALFEQFRGRWEVRQIRQNDAAIAFWRQVIADYTGGQYVETWHEGPRWRGPVQSFSNLV